MTMRPTNSLHAHYQTPDGSLVVKEVMRECSVSCVERGCITMGISGDVRTAEVQNIYTTHTQVMRE